MGGGLLPLKAGLAATITRRFASRGGEAIQAAVDAVGESDFDQRLEDNEELDVLVVRAVEAAARSSHEAKRRLLSNVVKAAVLDDAKVDESVLVVGVLQQLDAPHIRCLEEVWRAEKEALASGEMRPPARGAQRELTQAVREATTHYPPFLLHELERLGLLDGSVTWDGVSHVTGTTEFGARLLNDLRSP